MILDNLPQIELVGLTLYGEARGEPIEGIVAVGCVIRNRVKFEGSFYAVCLKPRQFSCWNQDDPNYSVLLNLILGNPANLSLS